MAQRVTFSSRNGIELSGRLEQPAGEPIGYLLLAHCFTCSKDLGSLRRLAHTLSESGIGVLSFDFTGLGQSEGEFEDTDFCSQTSDIVDAANWLAQEYEAPSVLVGHSLGGTAVLYAARELDGVKAVATIGAPADPVHVEKLFLEDIDAIETDGAAQVTIGGRPFTIRKSFLNDIRNHPPEQWLGEFHKELLILHSPVDNTVGIENAEKIFTSTRHPKSFVSLRQADHLMSNPEDAEYAGRIIGSWAETFLDRPSREQIKTNQQVAARIGRDHYTVTLQAGRHQMVADEPESAGGADRGGNPYDYLLASLGACTVMTLRMYADRKEWPLDSVTVHLSHEKVHSDDVSRCDTESASGSKVDQISREIDVVGDLSADQRGKLLEIADKCPVHRTLTGPIVVNTTFR